MRRYRKRRVLTRSYDDNLKIEYDPEVVEDLVAPEELTTVLDVFAKGARRLAATVGDQEQAMPPFRTKLANWADRKKDAVGKLQNLRTEKGRQAVGQSA